MNKEETTGNSKKNYAAPELKELGKIGEITNTTSADSTHTQDGGGGPNYYS
ncbi:hypothetical protein [Pedobacter arcticus]|uniref:hypothetical protein n=1 Tax=Pedobacter arcticus TaxID=752140 RepID=UPI00031C4072|nr:hypothetical protein [Pedobacter arcticus]